MNMCKVKLKQLKYLKYLSRLFNSEMMVSFNVDGHPGKWLPLKWIDNNKCNPVDYRTVLKNEIIIDIDIKVWDVVLDVEQHITKMLENEKIPFISAYSGGKGIHIHIFFDDHYLFKVVNFIEVKSFLYDYILTFSGFSTDAKYYDRAPVNKSRSLIRIIGGEKYTVKSMFKQFDGEHYVYYKDFPDERPVIDDPVFPDKIYVWDPFEILKNFRPTKVAYRYAPTMYVPIDEENPLSLTEYLYLITEYYDKV